MTDLWEGLPELLTQLGRVNSAIGAIASVEGCSFDVNGSNLHRFLGENLADLMAAIEVVVCSNGFNDDVIMDRYEESLADFLRQGLHS